MNNNVWLGMGYVDMSKNRLERRAHLILRARHRLTSSLTWHVEALVHIVLDLNSQH